jgi:hypothetical protein
VLRAVICEARQWAESRPRRFGAMAFNMSKHVSVGSRVSIRKPMDTPDWSTWDDDKGRTSAKVKKRLQAMFFQGNRKVQAEVMYVSKESERAKLRRKGLVKIRLKHPSGCMLSITADPTNLRVA